MPVNTKCLLGFDYGYKWLLCMIMQRGITAVLSGFKYRERIFPYFLFTKLFFFFRGISLFKHLMFAHLKNLFKGNKKDHAQSASLTKQQHPQQPASSTDSKRTLIVAEPKKLHNAKTLTAKQVIEIEQRRKRQLPVYPGLERFELIEKLGE